MSALYYALALGWAAFMAGHMAAGADWRLDAAIGMLCLVLARLFEKR